MHAVSANYAMPAILNTLNPVAKFGTKSSSSPLLNAMSTTGTTGTTTPTTSTSSTSSDGGLGSTFLNLLAQELQNQDPTAPVDSTAMVGQMISLNQLDQLISINQGITGAASTSGTTSAATQAAGAAGTSNALASGGISSLLSPSTAAAASTQLPFDPNTMMPLGMGSSSAMAASLNSSLNTATTGLSGTNNNATGGK